MGNKNILENLGIIDVRKGETSDDNFFSLLEEAIKKNAEIYFLRLAAPRKLRMQVISLIDPNVHTDRTTQIREKLESPDIKKIEFLMANPFGESFLRKLDSEGLTNWQIWRIREQILTFVKGLLFIAEKRKKHNRGHLAVGFHNNALLYNLGILNDNEAYKLLLRSYGKGGEYRGHNESINEVMLESGASGQLAEAFVAHYYSIRYNLGTVWISSTDHLGKFIRENTWPGLFKGNALRVEVIDLDRNEMEGITDVAKICLHKPSREAERKWLSMDLSTRSKLRFFKVPRLSRMCEENFKWRGKALRMEKIVGTSLFEIFSAIHKLASCGTEQYEKNAPKVLGFFIYHSLHALQEFRDISENILPRNSYEIYPYSLQLVSALKQISAFLGVISPANLNDVLNEAQSLGRVLEKEARFPFRDAHLKNRLLKWEKKDVPPDKSPESLICLDEENFQKTVEDHLYDIDFETAYNKVTEWDDIAHILLFENIGLIEMDFKNEDMLTQGKRVIATVKRWTGLDMKETDKDVFWKTVLFRSLREFCRRLWYSYVMPNTYKRRYSLEGRDYYLELAIFSRIQTGTFTNLQRLLQLCDDHRERIWRGTPRTSVNYVNPLLPISIVAKNAFQDSSIEENIFKILKEMHYIRDRTELIEKTTQLLMEMKVKSDTEETLIGKVDNLIKMEPSIMGFGIDVKKLIKTIFAKKNE